MEVQKKLPTTKELFQNKSVQSRFEQLLGEKAQGFISSVLQTINNNKLLVNAKPETVLNAAVTAASLDLPINQNLGFAWIVPYNGEAQFQMGWRGFVQLALRTGQYRSINVVEVYENQFKSFNALTEELIADFSVDGTGKIVGYAGYLRLVTGFEKTVYWSSIKVKNHASKYSKTYGKKVKGTNNLVYSPWNDESMFDAMAMKTVLKNMLSKWGIMSIELMTAHKFDQSVIKSEETAIYVDSADVIDISEVKENMRTNETKGENLP